MVAKAFFAGWIATRINSPSVEEETAMPICAVAEVWALAQPTLLEVALA